MTNEEILRESRDQILAMTPRELREQAARLCGIELSPRPECPTEHAGYIVVRNKNGGSSLGIEFRPDENGEHFVMLDRAMQERRFELAKVVHLTQREVMIYWRSLDQWIIPKPLYIPLGEPWLKVAVQAALCAVRGV